MAAAISAPIPGRIDHAWGARSDSHGELPQPPTSYLKRIYVDTVVFTPNQLAELVRVFGADHVVMGTDYPYDMAEFDPLGHIAGVEGFDAATVAALPAAIPELWVSERGLLPRGPSLAQGAAFCRRASSGRGMLDGADAGARRSAL